MGQAGCLCSNEAWPWDTGPGPGLWTQSRESSWSLFVPFWFLLHYPFYPLLWFPCFSPSPHSASFTFSTSLSLSIIFLWGTVRFLSALSKCHHQSFRLMTVLNGSSETALCGVLVSVSKENVCVCGRSVGLWCLLICFHSKVLQTVYEIQAATRANCSLPQTQLRTLCILPPKACMFSVYVMCYHNRIHCHSMPYLSSPTTLHNFYLY